MLFYILFWKKCEKGIDEFYISNEETFFYILEKIMKNIIKKKFPKDGIELSVRFHHVKI